MRKPAFLIAFVVALIAAGWFASRFDGGDAAVPEVAAGAPEEPAEPAGGIVAPPAEVETSVSSQRELARVEAAPVVPAPVETPVPAPTCRVFGQIADENGAPLAGVAIVLSAHRWSKTLEDAKVSESANSRTFETSTAADGRFLLEVPPTDSVAVLTVTPGLYRASATLRFGLDGRGPLQLGDHDIGTLRLAAAGAVEGFVRDAKGAPIEGARVHMATGRSSTIGRGTKTDASGAYVIGHVKPGTLGVNADHDGHVSEFRMPVEVAVGQTTGGVDFALGVSPTLKGRVVDSDGVPLEGIGVWGWPQGGKGAGATSAADGTFTIHLPQDEPYRLEAKLDPIDAFGVGDKDLFHPPGSTGIEIVLPTTVEVTFAVIDGAGAPVESFGLHVERGERRANDHGSSLSFRRISPPYPRPRPGGEMKVRVQPGLDRFHVVATGFQDARGDIPESVTETRRVEVRLGTGATVHGRALVKGAPAADSTALLEPGTFSSASLNGVPESTFLPDGYRKVYDTRAASDGRFRLEGVAAGTYRLTLRAPTGESHLRVPLDVGDAEVDLGDVELQPPGAIAGIVLVPQGRSAAGLVLRLGRRGSAAATTDAAGAFRFERVDAGRHAVYVDEAPGRVTSGGPFFTDVASGETSRLDIDLGEHGTCDVALSVTFDGAPARNVQVTLVSVADPSRSDVLGNTDAEGRVTGPTAAFGPATVRVYEATRSCLHPTVVLDLALDAEIDARVDFEFATLAIELPPGFTVPANGEAGIELRAVKSGTLASHRVPLDTDASRELRSFDGRTVTLERIAAAEYDAKVEIVELGIEPAREELASGGWRLRIDPILVHEQRVTLARGETATIRLP